MKHVTPRKRALFAKMKRERQAKAEAEKAVAPVPGRDFATFDLGSQFSQFSQATQDDPGEEDEDEGTTVQGTVSVVSCGLRREDLLRRQKMSLNNSSDSDDVSSISKESTSFS